MYIARIETWTCPARYVLTLFEGGPVAPRIAIIFSADTYQSWRRDAPSPRPKFGSPALGSILVGQARLASGRIFFEFGGTFSNDNDLRLDRHVRSVPRVRPEDTRK